MIGGILCYGKAEVSERVNGARDEGQVQEVLQNPRESEQDHERWVGCRAPLQSLPSRAGNRGSSMFGGDEDQTIKLQGQCYDNKPYSISDRLRHISDDTYHKEVFSLTAYSPYEESTGKYPGHPDYKKTATGNVAVEGWTIAADFDVLPPGSIVHISGLGFRRVEDCGGAVIGNKIDVYMEDIDACMEFGRQPRDVIVFRKGDGS